MTQTPNPGRKRRMDRYQEPQSGSVRTPYSRPADVSPVRQTRSPQARQPIGRSAELQARQDQMRQNTQYAPARRQTPAYSDFEQPGLTGGRAPYGNIRRKKKNPHTALWAAVALVCLMTSGVLLLFAAPQMLNISFDSMPSFAFVNGSLIQRDQRAIDAHAGLRQYLATDRIHNGIYIDGIHVGGMTRDEAVAAVSAVPGSAGGSFDIGVSVEGYMWSVNSNNVPLYRNVHEVVMQAYAVGRSTGTNVRSASQTPLSQRMSAVNAVLEQPIGFYTVTTYDREAVRIICAEIAGVINRDPVNASVASFDQATKKFTFNSDESGVYVDPDALYTQIVSRLDSGVYSDTIEVQPQVLLAAVTRAELMNSFGLVSSFTTKKTGNSNRTTNIALSADAINGTTVLPGETFSFNRATGERTEAKGYKPAAAIAGGETFDEIGGGVCQTSSTLFNAVVRADLEIASRKPHAWPSDYVPKGEDATVNWPNLDFKFTNNTDWPVFIVAWCDKSAKTVTVEIYGKSLANGVTIDLESEVVYKKDPPSETLYVYNPSLAYGTEEQTVKARTGYRVETYKVYLQNGQEVSRVLLHTSDYKMYQKTVEHNKPNVYGT